ncbi:MAG: endonuclease domain-containing protein [Alphaproteobacteria bacterium]
MRGSDAISIGRARTLRRRSTRAEAVLWRHLRDRQLAGFKFVRQEPIGAYFADFVCRDLHLVIEVDGGQHADSAADGERDATMRRLGYRTIRVWNNDVLNNIEGVLYMLKAELENAPHPVPLPASGEREPVEMPALKQGAGRGYTRMIVA